MNRAKSVSSPTRPKKQVKAPAKKKPVAARKALPKPEARRPGRPTSYTVAVGLAVCGWIKQGYTLRQIGALPNMPNKATIIRWLAVHEEFCDQYARAGEVRALVMADEIIEISDDSRNDWMEREGKNGTVEIVPCEELISRAKVRIDARKWLMAKMAPKRFGASVAVTGKDGGPVQHTHELVAALIDEIDGAGTGLPDGGDTTD